MIDQIKPLLGKLALFAQERMGFKHPPKLFLRNDTDNSQKALGKTAFYNPQEQSVTLFVHGRHPKDILRSFAHELVHHTQNLRGDLSSEKMGEMGSNYAQDNEHLRNMEKEAYLDGNMCFRDWEDTIEDKDLILIKIAESKFLKENKTMTTKITKESLKETIQKVLNEFRQMSDEELVAYAKRNKAIPQRMVQAALARIKKKAAMQAAKEKAEKKSSEEPSKTQKGIASYFADYIKEGEIEIDSDSLDKSPSQSLDEIPQMKPDLEVVSDFDKLISKLRKSGNDEAAERLIMIKKELANMEQVPTPKIASPSPDINEAGCGGSHSPGKRCDECGHMEESEAIEENEELEEGKQCCGMKGCPGPGEPHSGKYAIKEGEELEEADSDVKMVPKDEVSDEDEVVVPDGPGNLVGVKKESIQTPEQENKLYENRFAPRNTRLFEKLVKDWTK